MLGSCSDDADGDSDGNGDVDGAGDVDGDVDGAGDVNGGDDGDDTDCNDKICGDAKSKITETLKRNRNVIFCEINSIVRLPLLRSCCAQSPTPMKRTMNLLENCEPRCFNSLSHG
jgi:hypothetical protein